MLLYVVPNGQYAQFDCSVGQRFSNCATDSRVRGERGKTKKYIYSNLFQMITWDLPTFAFCVVAPHFNLGVCWNSKMLLLSLILNSWWVNRWMSERVKGILNSPILPGTSQKPRLSPFFTSVKIWLVFLSWLNFPACATCSLSIMVHEEGTVWAKMDPYI